MSQGIKLTDWQTEQIRATWLVTRSAAEGARAAGCNPRTAQRYVREHLPELTVLAAEKEPDLADALTAAINRLVTAIFDGRKIDEATLAQIATSLGILIDKRQLVTGQATERHEHRDANTARIDLARRVDELAERRRTAEVDLQPERTGRSGAGS